MNRTEPKKNWFRVGRGTQLMMLCIAIFGVYSFASRPPTPNTSYLEAGPTGRLVPAAGPLRPLKSLPPLWKPEPQLILDAKDTLRLTVVQATSVGEISARWNARKRELEAAMARFVPRVSGGHKQEAAIASSLGDYSQLSRTYDAERNASWADALSKLTLDQRREIAKLGSTARGIK